MPASSHAEGTRVRQASAWKSFKTGVRFFPRFLLRSSRNLIKPKGLAILGATALASYGVSHFNDSITTAFQSWDPGRNYTGFGRDYYGTAMNMSLPQMSVLASGLAFKNQEFYGTGYSMMSAFIMERMVVGALQMGTGDSRPDPNVKRNPTGGTFPSGHATSVAAFAGVVHARHGAKAASLFHIAALYTGWSRIADGAHRPHEVVAGLGIGEAIGWAAGQAGNDSEDELISMAIAPKIDLARNEYGLMLQIRF